jgi:flagellar motor switch protein FliN
MSADDDVRKSTDSSREPAAREIVWTTLSNADTRPLNSSRDIDAIQDVPVELSVEVGRKQIAILDVMQFAEGAVLELDGLAGEPLRLFVNGHLIAQGEVVVVNEKFGIRLTDILSEAERRR